MVKTVDDEIKVLNAKRAFLKSKIEKHRIFIENYAKKPHETTIVDVEVRLECLKPLLDEYTGIYYQEIPLVTDPDAIQAIKEECNAFEDSYFGVVSTFTRMIELIRNPLKPKSIKNSSEPENKPNLKLPEVHLPKFSGKHDDWPEFRDVYEALVGNTKLSGVEKFLYLMGCCKGGDAESFLNIYKMTEENYALAWEALKGRYEDKKLLLDRHLSELMKLKPITNENPNELRKLLNEFSSRIKQIEQTIPEHETLWDLILIHLMSWRLDENVRRSWEASLKKNQIPKWSEMLKFLEEKCRVADQMSVNSRNSNSKSSNSKSLSPPKSKMSPNSSSGNPYSKFQNPIPKITTSLVVNTPATVKCRVCDAQHYTYKCEVLLQMSDVRERISKVQEKKLCFNCLKPNHIANECRNEKNCRECNQKHHSILHIAKRTLSPEPEDSRASESDDSDQEPEKVLIHCAHESAKEKQVLLSTAIVQVQDCVGKSIPCRALLDSGSESCFMSEKMAQILKLRKTKKAIQVIGLNQESISVTNSVCATIQSYESNYSEKIEFLIVPKISGNIPSKRVNIPNSIMPSKIQLADPKFYMPSSVDMILGAEYFFDIIKSKGEVLIPKQLSLRDTVFGYVVHGKFQTSESQNEEVKCMFSRTYNPPAQFEEPYKMGNNMINPNPKAAKEEKYKYSQELCVGTAQRDEDEKFSTRKSCDEFEKRSSSMSKTKNDELVVQKVNLCHPTKSKLESPCVVKKSIQISIREINPKIWVRKMSNQKLWPFRLKIYRSHSVTKEVEKSVYKPYQNIPRLFENDQSVAIQKAVENQFHGSTNVSESIYDPSNNIQIKNREVDRRYQVVQAKSREFSFLHSQNLIVLNLMDAESFTEIFYKRPKISSSRSQVTVKNGKKSSHASYLSRKSILSLFKAKLLWNGPEFKQTSDEGGLSHAKINRKLIRSCWTYIKFKSKPLIQVESEMLLSPVQLWYSVCEISVDCIGSKKIKIRRALSKIIAKCCLFSIESIHGLRVLMPKEDFSKCLQIKMIKYSSRVRPLNARPPKYVTKTTTNKCSYRYFTRKKFQVCWKCWYFENLHEFHKSSKYFKPKVNIEPRRLVIVKSEDKPEYNFKKKASLIFLMIQSDLFVKLSVHPYPVKLVSKALSSLCVHIIQLNLFAKLSYRDPVELVCDAECKIREDHKLSLRKSQNSFIVEVVLQGPENVETSVQEIYVYLFEFTEL